MPVAFAEMAVLVAVGVSAQVLVPEEGEGDPFASQLPMDRGPVGLGSASRWPGAGIREERSLEGGVIQVGRERPGQVGLPETGEVKAERE